MKLDRQAISVNSGGMGFFRPTWVKVLTAMILVLAVVVAGVYSLGSRKNQPVQQLRASPTTVQSSPTNVQVYPTTNPPPTKIITHDYSTNPTKKYTSPNGHVSFMYY